MAEASQALHEPGDALSESTHDLHRALVSLQEELEAVDWYRQRADACADDALRQVLLHNMREEVEHACMVLEWLRRNEATFDLQLGTYLFTDTAIAQAEETAGAPAKEEAGAPGVEQGSIGSLKGT